MWKKLSQKSLLIPNPGKGEKWGEEDEALSNKKGPRVRTEDLRVMASVPVALPYYWSLLEGVRSKRLRIWIQQGHQEQSPVPGSS